MSTTDYNFNLADHYTSLEETVKAEYVYI